MAKYDDASWHYGGDFPKDLPHENGATHIGFFLMWCVDNNLISEFQLEEFGADVEKVKNRSLTGVEFLINNCDEKFTDEDLNETGNQFANDYYEEDTEFGKRYGSYLQDYEQIFENHYNNRNVELENFYYIENSLANYDIIKAVISNRFLQWKEFMDSK